MVYLPWSTRQQQDRQREQLKEQFIQVQTDLSVGAATEMGPFYTMSRKVYLQLERDYALAQGKDPDAVERALIEANYQQLAANMPVDGLLSIARIDLSLPIIDNAVMAHLDISPSSIKDSPKPWQGGNYVIAGHRSTVYGRHFNRLGELVVGDLIQFVDIDNRYYHYRIDTIKIIHESDLSILDNTTHSKITLITCDPIGVRNPDQRLVITATLTGNQAQ